MVGRFDGLEIFHGTGSSFDDPVALGAQGIVEEVAAVDLNSDGMDDLVYGDDQGGHRIMRRLQTTPGVFGSAVQIASTTSGRFSVGDVNTDGRPDILVEDPWAVELQILLHNPANQGFTSTTEPVDRARSAAVGDVNGDGLNDVLALGGALFELDGEAGGDLAAPTVEQVDLYLPSAVEIADMNADGRDDALVFTAANLDVRLQTESGTLQVPRCPFPTLTPNAYAGVWSETAVGDLNDDGRPDVAVTELDETVRMATQIAPGSHLATSLGIGVPESAQIHDSVQVTASLDASVDGCLGNRDVEIWRKMPGGSAELLSTVPLSPNGNATWGIGITDDPGVLGTVEYRAIWAGDEFRDGSQSPWQALEVVKRSTSIELETSDPQILVGGSASLDATLTGGEPGSAVTFSSIVNGVSTPIDTVNVDGAGQASIQVSPTTTTTYGATYAGDGAWKSATSTPLEIQVSKHATSLKLHTREGPIPFGSSGILTATLEGGADDRRVEFYSVREGHERLVGSVAPDDDGIARLEVTPKANTHYVARFKSDGTWAAAKSGRVEVQVRVLATGSMIRFVHRQDGAAVYRCCVAYYTFRVTPNYGGEPARLSLGARTRHGWRQIDEVKFPLRANSTVTVRVQIAGGAGHAFRFSGCLRDQPDRRGWCSSHSEFRFLGGRVPAATAKDRTSEPARLIAASITRSA